MEIVKFEEVEKRIIIRDIPVILVGKLEVKIKDKVKIKSLRNRIVHSYGTIDKELLWEISHTNIKELRNEIEKIIGL